MGPVFVLPPSSSIQAFLLKVLLCRVKTRRKGTHISCTKSYEHPMFILVTVEPGISGFVNLL